MKSGVATSADLACDDDSCVGLQSSISGKVINGANLLWIIVDGFGMSGEGAYSLGYSIQ
jgi:hypothetical protein